MTQTQMQTQTDTFTTLSRAIAERWQAMTANGATIYRATVSKDTLWDTYLEAWPAGSNPIRVSRREHDCQTCRSFIRAVGGVVTIINGQLATIWDINVGAGTPNQIVADAMSALVRAAAIENLFLHTERSAGALKTHAEDPAGGVRVWNHFHVNLPQTVVARGVDIGTRQAETRSTHDVLARGLRELTLESIDTVLDLIRQNSLYRGEEQRGVLEEFRKLKVAYMMVLAQGYDLDLFAWRHSTQANPVVRIRNTSIGTLLVDLSAGEDLERSVLAYEAKLNPLNYKRPTALVSKAQIERAQAAIASLNLTSALERRYAVAEDITANNVLFVDRATKLKGSPAETVFDDLISRHARMDRTLDHVAEISMDKFLADVLPLAKSLEILVENSHAANLVSLIAPVDPTATRLFKWPNNFSWSYTGDVTDSIKERVKRAGGAVVGDLCCRLAWDYVDDLDFHMIEPEHTGHIYYPNRRERSPNGGVLDLDANGADGPRSDPAENIVYANRRLMREGVYTLQVNQYNRRTTSPDDRGFTVEIEFDGNLIAIHSDRVLRTGETIEVAQIEYRAGQFRIVKSLPSTTTPKTIWGVQTQQFHKVNLAMLSPNHWDSTPERPGIGNRHFFFMLDGCQSSDTARGFYNEFLDSRLDAHRRTLELVGAKMRTDESERQLSGLGFSSSSRAQITVRVKGSFERVLKVNI
jgi:hypothetical protein